MNDFDTLRFYDYLIAYLKGRLLHDEPMSKEDTQYNMDIFQKINAISSLKVQKADAVIDNLIG